MYVGMVESKGLLKKNSMCLNSTPDSVGRNLESVFLIHVPCVSYDAAILWITLLALLMGVISIHWLALTEPN